jgi:hypothetical protein
MRRSTVPSLPFQLVFPDGDFKTEAYSSLNSISISFVSNDGAGATTLSIITHSIVTFSKTTHYDIKCDC